VTGTKSTSEPNLIELEAVHADLERLHERCEKGLILQAEITTVLRDLDSRARAALPKESDLFRLYDSRMGGVTDYWHVTIGRYVSPTSCRNVGRRIAVIRQVLQEIEPEFLRSEARTPTQLYFQAGEGYRARQGFFRLLRKAAETIDIADPYLGPDVFDFIEVLDPALMIRLLTGTPKPLFVEQLHGFQETRRNVEARSNDRNHDRFIILDGSEVWHLGASINGLGKKACMLNRIASGPELERILADFEAWWTSGSCI
jgi:hypothetical protein